MSAPLTAKQFPCYITEMHEGATDQTDVFYTEEDVYKEIQATFRAECHNWEDVVNFVEAHNAEDEDNWYYATPICNQEEYEEYFDY